MRNNTSFLRRMCQVLLFIGLACVAPMTYANDDFVTKKTFVEKYFGWFLPEKDQQGPEPTKTLQAPFVNTEEELPTSALSSIYRPHEEGQRNNAVANLSISHRSRNEINAWLTEALAKSLNFSLNDMRSFGRTVKPYYSQQGIGQFKQFLMDLNAIAIMKNNQKRVATYLISSPEILSQGIDNDGAYKWIYKAPIMLTYVDNSNPPRKVNDIAQAYQIEVSIKRTPNVKLYNQGIFIDNMSAKRVKQ